MGAESFFRRWARLKSEDNAGTGPAQNQATESEGPARDSDAHSVAESSPTHSPTIEDVAHLAPDSDYSAFVAKGVDKNVQLLAMKKLFSDPHFNIMDGLDIYIYIDDYNKAAPIPAAMLASLKQAQGSLDPIPAVDDACADLSETPDRLEEGEAGTLLRQGNNDPRV
jgi:hypothetical protein